MRKPTHKPIERKKLVLDKERVRVLQTADLAQAAGGEPPSCHGWCSGHIMC